jgi:hypothetical protein
VESSCEFGIEHSGSIKCSETRDLSSSAQLHGVSSRSYLRRLMSLSCKGSPRVARRPSNQWKLLSTIPQELLLYNSVTRKQLVNTSTILKHSVVRIRLSRQWFSMGSA